MKGEKYRLAKEMLTANVNTPDEKIGRLWCNPPPDARCEICKNCYFGGVSTCTALDWRSAKVFLLSEVAAYESRHAEKKDKPCAICGELKEDHSPYRSNCQGWVPSRNSCSAVRAMWQQRKNEMNNRIVDKKRSHEHAVRLYEKGIQLNCSTGIDDSDTYGYGKLDDYGFFEYPLYFLSALDKEKGK